MNPVLLFLIIVTLPLLLGGCGEKVALDSVNYDELEEREGITYLKGSDSLFTGKAYSLYPNGFGGRKAQENLYENGKRHGLSVYWHAHGKKNAEGNYKNGKLNGMYVMWWENGQKMNETLYENDKAVSGSEKYWNRKGEPLKEQQEGLFAARHNAIYMGDLNFREGLQYDKNSGQLFSGTAYNFEGSGYIQAIYNNGYIVERVLKVVMNGVSVETAKEKWKKGKLILGSYLDENMQPVGTWEEAYK